MSPTERKGPVPPYFSTYPQAADGRSRGRLERIDAVIDYLKFVDGELEEPVLVAKICNLVHVGSITAWRYAFQMRDDPRVAIRLDRWRIYYRARHGKRRDLN